MSYNINKQNIKSKINGDTVCKYWLESRCKKGDACEFLHERRPDKFPECPHGMNCTKIGICPYKHTKRVIRDCMSYEHGYCKDGKNCKLAHKQKDICLNYLLGFCPDGPNCKFFHLKTPVHSSQDNLAYLTKGKKRERDLQLTESKKYSSLLLAKLNTLNEAESFIDSIYTNIYYNSTKMNILFQLTYGELPTKTINKLTIKTFLNILPLNDYITSYKQCFDFYSNTVALFVHYQTNDDNDDALFADICKSAFIIEQGKFYVLLHKHFESKLKYSLNFSVFVDKCDYMLIEIRDIEVLLSLLSKDNDGLLLNELDVINRSFIVTYKDMKRKLNELEQQVQKLQHEIDVCEFDKYQQIHKLNVKVHEVELKNRIMLENENERQSRYQTYLVSCFSFEIGCQRKNVNVNDCNNNSNNNIEPLVFTNIYEEVNSKDEFQGEKYLCVICFENERNVYFSKCGHCVVCFDCVGGLKKEGSKYNCPACRKFSNIQKIIYS